MNKNLKHPHLLYKINYVNKNFNYVFNLILILIMYLTTQNFDVEVKLV